MIEIGSIRIEILDGGGASLMRGKTEVGCYRTPEIIATHLAMALDEIERLRDGLAQIQAYQANPTGQTPVPGGTATLCKRLLDPREASRQNPLDNATDESVE